MDGSKEIKASNKSITILLIIPILILPNFIFATLLDTIRNGYTKPRFKNNSIIISPKGKGICICSIGKNENLYAKEFIEYYLLIGVKKIIIYDNNDINGENF